ncbi:exosortase A [Aestuariicella hydrocarbonica]|uniref:Exosortase A n=1 Tax=Pseudomaricurvus hydrocarbonicus TaxID=1470433 RepID=A0A9E5JSE7_9GAMM|nr:exosortase A [Aestuariicella hydrocarbonica]NHO64693.1 exosortase A [Aestuariicella hydrocarbonica]
MIDMVVSPTHWSKRWHITWIQLGVYLASLLVLYWSTILSMVKIWQRSETFAHGFIIAPISIWLVWRLRNQLKALVPKVEPLFIIPMGLVGGLWLLGYLGDVLVVQQLTFVLLLIFGVCALLGFEISKLLSFPLFFLLFMVPMGESLVPKMMEFTASSTVWLINLVNIPVYREGLLFHLPSGSWSVVEACSGVRYLIASITLGFLYGYLTYRSLSKRFIFILVSIVVPILANSVRAFLIVMIGHASGMTLAVGADHLIYGWAFFGLVIFLMFLIGSFFADNTADENTESTEFESKGRENIESDELPGVKTYSVVFCILLFSFVWPLMIKILPELQSETSKLVLINPSAPPGWNSKTDPNWQWHPITQGTDFIHRSFYENDHGTVGLFINQYINQVQGNELVNSLDKWVVPEVKGWQLIEQKTTDIKIYGRDLKVEQARLKSLSSEFLVWRWYRIGQYNTANPYLAKGLEVISKLSPHASVSARIYVVTPIVESIDNSMTYMQSFIDNLSPELEVALNANKEMM